MEKWVCDVCGYIYDPEIGDPDNGIAAGTAFADLPEDWLCETSFYFIVLCKNLTRCFLVC